MLIPVSLTSNITVLSRLRESLLSGLVHPGSLIKILYVFHISPVTTTLSFV
jgi:hypothetical protein